MFHLTFAANYVSVTAHTTQAQLVPPIRPFEANNDIARGPDQNLVAKQVFCKVPGTCFHRAGGWDQLSLGGGWVFEDKLSIATAAVLCLAGFMPVFTAGSQQDAHEFLLCLLSAICSETRYTGGICAAFH